MTPAVMPSIFNLRTHPRWLLPFYFATLFSFCLYVFDHSRPTDEQSGQIFCSSEKSVALDHFIRIWYLIYIVYNGVLAAFAPRKIEEKHWEKLCEEEKAGKENTRKLTRLCPVSTLVFYVLAVVLFCISEPVLVLEWMSLCSDIDTTGWPAALVVLAVGIFVYLEIICWWGICIHVLDHQKALEEIERADVELGIKEDQVGAKPIMEKQ